MGIIGTDMSNNDASLLATASASQEQNMPDFPALGDSANDFSEAEQGLARRITRPSPWSPSLNDDEEG